VALNPGEACNGCGRILSVRETYVERKPVVPQVLQGSSNVGASVGPSERNLVGAVIYLPLGNETAEKPYVGGVGTPEMRERFRDTIYEIAVRMDDGSTRFLQRTDGTRFRAGDRVRLAGTADLELVLE
jgi:outer membrane lipoprotein SlyB